MPDSSLIYTVFAISGSNFKIVSADIRTKQLQDEKWI